MMVLWTAGVVVGLFGLLVVLAYVNVPMFAWFVYGALVLEVTHAPPWLQCLLGLVAFIFNVPFVRQVIVTAPIVKAIRFFKLLPMLSPREQAEIEAGTVWVDSELFSGKPNFKRILSESYPTLTVAEQAFVDGPVEQVCRMATDWEINQRKDLPPAVWGYLRQKSFFGLTIPQEYGGLGLSNTAYSAVMTKLTSRSLAYTAIVGASNSLGPALLLRYYGTDEQKQQYLPRLATGKDIPCFALAEPTVGTDAASLHSGGTVFRNRNGTLYLRLNWQKQYVTLGAIATLIGLAIPIRDPENLLGKGPDGGVTCVLVPADTPGVQLARRHDPMGLPCCQASITGRNVVLPASQIIGGEKQLGQGWAMLAQTLAASRGLNSSAQAAGVAKTVAQVTSAYSVVQEQFSISSKNNEKREEPLARIGGLTYLIDAARLYVCGAIDQGEQPTVVSAVIEHQLTKLSQQLVNDGMDILGIAGICCGPHNLLANVYTAIPVPMTAENTNFLIRNSNAYDQGAIRCHSYRVDEIAALEDNNIAAFDHAVWRHMGLTVCNLTRAKVLSWTHGYLAQAPVHGETARYYQKLTWGSATFAALSDLAMLSCGGRLKHHEKITSRLADLLSWLYLATATLRRFEAEGCRTEDLPLVHWSMNYSLAQLQTTLEGVLANINSPVLGRLLKTTTLPWFRCNPIGVMPTDAQSHAVAQLLQSPEGRSCISTGSYVPTDKRSLGKLERAYRLSIVTMPVFSKIKTAFRHGKLTIIPPIGRVEAALRAGIITGAESDLAITAEQAQLDALQIDSFTPAEYRQLGRGYIGEEITGTES